MNLNSAPKIWNEKYEFAKFENAFWIKLFHHKVHSQEDFFDDPTDILQYINKPNQYSIISEYKSIARYNQSNYEFLLYYPEFSGYNRWSQKLFPTEEEDEIGKETAEGYENISISWTDNHWGGLVTSYQECTQLEGSIGSNDVYYSLGFKKKCGNYQNDVIPAYELSAHEVYLWMRVKAFYFRGICSLSGTSTIHIQLYFITFLFN